LFGGKKGKRLIVEAFSKKKKGEGDFGPGDSLLDERNLGSEKKLVLEILFSPLRGGGYIGGEGAFLRGKSCSVGGSSNEGGFHLSSLWDQDRRRVSVPKRGVTILVGRADFNTALGKRGGKRKRKARS